LEKRDLLVKEEEEKEFMPPEEVKNELPHLESFLTAVVVGSILGTIVAVNHEATRLFGRTEDELVGHSLSVLMPEPYKSQHDGYLFRHEKFGTEKLLGRTRLLLAEHKELGEIPVSISLGKLHIDGYFIATFRDYEL